MKTKVDFPEMAGGAHILTKEKKRFLREGACKISVGLVIFIYL